MTALDEMVARGLPLDRVRNACGRARTWVDRGLSGLIGAVGLRIALG